MLSKALSSLAPQWVSYMTNDTLHALHLTFSELRELIDAENLHSERLKATQGDATLADRVQKKAALLLDFSRQKFAVSRAKAHAAKLRKDYETFTFGTESPDTEPEE